MTQENKHLDLAAKYRQLQRGFERLIDQVPAETAKNVRKAARNCDNRARRQVDEANQARKPKPSPESEGFSPTPRTGQ